MAALCEYFAALYQIESGALSLIQTYKTRFCSGFRLISANGSEFRIHMKISPPSVAVIIIGKGTKEPKNTGESPRSSIHSSG